VVQTKKVYISGSKLLPIVFSQGGGTISSGQLFIVALSDSLAPPNPTFSWYAELKYLDV